jgi:hypothetical protein
MNTENIIDYLHSQNKMSDIDSGALYKSLQMAEKIFVS